jgi:hypothetical protein
MGMLAGDHEADAGHERVAAWCADSSGCSDRGGGEHAPTDSDSPHEDHVLSGCAGCCCIKGFVPMDDAGAMLVAPLVAILPPDAIHRPVRGPISRGALARQDWRACDPPSLLRLRCALLI